MITLTQTESLDQNSLQELLRDVRTRKNLRQTDIADRLGVPQSFVSKYESGERRLDVIELRSVCHAMDIRLSEFIELLEKKLQKKDSSKNEAKH